MHMRYMISSVVTAKKVIIIITFGCFKIIARRTIARYNISRYIPTVVGYQWYRTDRSCIIDFVRTFFQIIEHDHVDTTFGRIALHICTHTVWNKKSARSEISRLTCYFYTCYVGGNKSESIRYGVKYDKRKTKKYLFVFIVYRKNDYIHFVALLRGLSYLSSFCMETF
jgi:hypothetical protein